MCCRYLHFRIVCVRVTLPLRDVVGNGRAVLVALHIVPLHREAVNDGRHLVERAQRVDKVYARREHVEVDEDAVHALAPLCLVQVEFIKVQRGPDVRRFDDRAISEAPELCRRLRTVRQNLPDGAGFALLARHHSAFDHLRAFAKVVDVRLATAMLPKRAARAHVQTDGAVMRNLAGQASRHAKDEVLRQRCDVFGKLEKVVEHDMADVRGPLTQGSAQVDIVFEKQLREHAERDEQLQRTVQAQVGVGDGHLLAVRLQEHVQHIRTAVGRLSARANAVSAAQRPVRARSYILDHLRSGDGIDPPVQHVRLKVVFQRKRLAVIDKKRPPSQQSAQVEHDYSKQPVSNATARVAEVTASDYRPHRQLRLHDALLQRLVLGHGLREDVSIAVE